MPGLSSLASDEPKHLEPRQFSAGGDEETKAQNRQAGPIFVQPSPSAMAQAAGAAALGARAASPDNKADQKKRLASANATSRQPPLAVRQAGTRLGLSALHRTAGRGASYGISSKSIALRRIQGPPHG